MSSTHAARIRHARPSDVAAISAIVTAAYQPYVARIGRRPAPMDADYASEINQGTVVVLDIGDLPVGVMVLHQKGDHLLIDNIAVDAPRQGAGLGSLMLHFAEQEALARGLPELRLYTNALMTENLAFYQRRGFLETGRRIDEGYDRVFFCRKLAPVAS